MHASDIERFRKLGESVRAAGIGLKHLVRLTDERLAYDDRILRCQVLIHRDPLRTLGFVLFFAGAHRDAHSQYSREFPSAILLRHLDAFRGGDVVRYVVLLKAERLMFG